MSGALITLFGFLGADPEERITRGGEGTKVVSLRLATTVWREGGEHTIWWRVQLWGSRFDNKVRLLKKGSSVVVSGDVVRAEGYSKRDGGIGVSLDVNAHSIVLSPFGKKREDLSLESNKEAGTGMLEMEELVDSSLGESLSDDVPF